MYVVSDIIAEPLQSLLQTSKVWHHTEYTEGPDQVDYFDCSFWPSGHKNTMLSDPSHPMFKHTATPIMQLQD